MFYLNDMCCLCLNSKIDLRRMSEVNYGNLSYYNKIIICIPQMVFTELNNEKCVCKKCCDFVDEMYSFRDVCLRNGYILKNYISKLRSVSNQHGDVYVNLNDLKNYLDKNESNDLFDEKPINISNRPDLNHKNGSSVKKCTDNGEKPPTFTEEQFSKFEELTTDLKSDIDEEKTPVFQSEDCTKDVTTDNQNPINSQITIKTEPILPSPCADQTQLTYQQNDELITKNDTHIFYNTPENDDSMKNDFIPSVIKSELVETDPEAMSNDEVGSLIIDESPSSKKTRLKKKVELTPEDESKIKDQLHSLELLDIPDLALIENGAKKIFKCQHCPKVSSTYYNFLKHFRTHKKKMPYKCSACKKCFIFSKDLVKHLKNHMKVAKTKTNC